ncbi:MAG: betaine-aldehyde dehydrogenase [Gammaproteobacteria bacterium]
MRAQPQASHFVAGRYTENPNGQLIESIYPASGDVIAQLHAADAALVEQAVAAAQAGFVVWSTTPAAERGRVLRRAADILRERNQELAELETLDTGKALQETLVADAPSGADCMEYFGGIAASISGEHIDLGGSFAYTRREPLGVCAGIGAWNYPIQIACWKSAPALACGNAMIFKPSELTPLSALKLAEILRDAGLPDGVFNVLQGYGEVGALLSSHPGIAKVSLTGSVATGTRVMLGAAPTLKKVTLELGGKSPIIVFEDADIENAVSRAMLGNFYSTGQVCSNGTRVFVQRRIRDQFLARLIERTEAIRLGDPLDEQTQLGPLVSRAQYDKVLGYMQLGVEEGATLVTGGGAATVAGFEQGLFVQPTVFTEVQDSMRIAREEIFGPVMCVFDFDDEAEVIARANDTDMGLAAGVFTRDIQRAHRTIAQLQAGTCWINNYNLTPIEMPFGGYKKSGIGRENAHAAIEHYTQLKSVYVEMGDVEAPY